VENKFGVSIARNSTLKESVLPNRKVQRFLIASGSSLSLINPGVSLAEIKPTDLAARGITGTKLKSIGTQEVEIVLGTRICTHEFLVTKLDIEYSGVFGLDLLRQMEAKVDLCSGGLIIGRRRFELTGLDCQDRVSPQVTVTKPVAENVGGLSDLINLTRPQGKEKTTGTQDAGRLANLKGGGTEPSQSSSSKTLT
jgi:hypothetical protein